MIHECELGYWLGKPHWGQGYIPEAATELIRYAFENLGMAAIWCGYYDGNNKSRRVMEKHAISQVQYDKSLGDLRDKMEMQGVN